MFDLTDFDFMQSLTGVIPFAAYFAVALVMVAIYTAIYTWVTPHDELKLIKENNIAAAVSFIGSLLGFTQPLMTAMDVSANIIDFAMWGSIALVVQIFVFQLIRIPFPKAIERIEKGEVAMGVLIGGISLAIGALTSTAMSY
ncbi:DUF350 domain-containing protein [Vibrio crassostreae]|uniref:DUF350 domain-containing protein n=1 Tax=Vibrio crassostreae TaxID=246167 RepID=UPI001B30A7D2|nr:DUF350 domain-containing protein [Vibrio crassostreae]